MNRNVHEGKNAIAQMPRTNERMNVHLCGRLKLPQQGALELQHRPQGVAQWKGRAAVHSHPGGVVQDTMDDCGQLEKGSVHS